MMKISPLEISLSLITAGLVVNSFDLIHTGLAAYQTFYINNVVDKKEKEYMMEVKNGRKI